MCPAKIAQAKIRDAWTPINKISDKINIAKRIRTISNENLSNLIKYIMKENPILIEDVDSDNIQLKLDMLSKKTYNEILEIMNTPIKESKK